MYSHGMLLLLRALTPLHVGIGRYEALHVDLPVQRDEFGFPTIWSSSLKGAVKAVLPSDVKRHLGSEPGEVSTTPSHVAILDAKLLFIPVRVLRGVWMYATSPTLLSYLNNYLEPLKTMLNVKNVEKINSSAVESDVGGGLAVTNRGDVVAEGKAVVNEVDIPCTVRKNLVEELRLHNVVKETDILNLVNQRGLIVLPETNNQALNIINKSLLIQYRVRLKRETKTVEEGPWSEEYIPMETVFVSLILCRDDVKSGAKAAEVCAKLKDLLHGRSIYVGGKETIGRGLAKLYLVEAK